LRKEIGTPTRQLFFARLADIAPDFKRSSRYDVRGFTWMFARKERDLRQVLWFQRHRYRDAFTVELAWSCVLDNASEAPFGDPSSPFTRDGCRFRLGRFWEPQKDVWWDVGASRLNRALTTIGALVGFRSSDSEAAPSTVKRAVDDASAKIVAYALPYFESVARWSRNEPV
jgi:hypothetical protein